MVRIRNCIDSRLNRVSVEISCELGQLVFDCFPSSVRMKVVMKSARYVSILKYTKALIKTSIILIFSGVWYRHMKWACVNEAYVNRLHVDGNGPLIVGPNKHAIFEA